MYNPDKSQLTLFPINIYLSKRYNKKEIKKNDNTRTIQKKNH